MPFIKNEPMVTDEDYEEKVKANSVPDNETKEKEDSLSIAKEEKDLNTDTKDDKKEPAKEKEEVKKKASSTLPRSFRVTEETLNKFREIAGEVGGNQEQTLARLIEVYEMQGAKNAPNANMEEIDIFQGLQARLTDIYISALNTASDAKEAVRGEFKALIVSKERTIESLKDRIELLEKTNGNIQKDYLAIKKAVEEIKKSESEALNRAKKAEERLAGRELDYKELQRRYNLSVNDIADYTKAKLDDKTQIAELEKRERFLTREVDEKSARVNSLEAEISQLKQTMASLKEDYEKRTKEREDQLREAITIEYEREYLEREKRMQNEYSEKLISMVSEFNKVNNATAQVNANGNKPQNVQPANKPQPQNAQSQNKVQPQRHNPSPLNVNI